MPLPDQALKLKKATFAMGCFWHPDGLFGTQRGVLRTRVGYTGGKFTNPTYTNLGDHTEAIDIDYDPQVTNYSELLKLFWTHHDPTTKAKLQYQSAIFYHNDEQQKLAKETKVEQENSLKGNVTTRIEPFTVFYDAEDYHQKYYLQAHHAPLFRSLGIEVKDLIHSSLAAKINCYIVGEGSLQVFDAESSSLGLSKENIEYIRKQIAKGKSAHC